MNGVCPKCGLSEEFCTCETLVREEQTIRVYLVKRRYNKFTTIIDGMEKDVDKKQILKELKTKLACGGTINDNGNIELQGNHKDKIKTLLVKLGFAEDQIEVN
ncbi:MAG: stress response translation initiation inhibitor YciH [Candidatus Aenigmarchaeota archaeon]|nr:stress response translation initiation inhibitor YciH [Candidatus Aenigmarchaeota archaeon]